jgi:hypothetical protein
MNEGHDDTVPLTPTVVLASAAPRPRLANSIASTRCMHVLVFWMIDCGVVRGIGMQGHIRCYIGYFFIFSASQFQSIPCHRCRHLAALRRKARWPRPQTHVCLLHGWASAKNGDGIQHTGTKLLRKHEISEIPRRDPEIVPEIPARTCYSR